MIEPTTNPTRDTQAGAIQHRCEPHALPDGTAAPHASETFRISAPNGGGALAHFVTGPLPDPAATVPAAATTEESLPSTVEPRSPLLGEGTAFFEDRDGNSPAIDPTVSDRSSNTLMSVDLAGESLSKNPQSAIRTPQSRLSQTKVTEENRRKQIHDTIKALQAQRHPENEDIPLWSKNQICKQVGISRATLWRYLQPGGLTSKIDRCGRKPAYLPTESELAVVRMYYSMIDESEARGRGLGSSKIVAFRLAAKSDDDRLSAQFRGVVLKGRKTKTVPPSWLRLLDTPASVIDYGRDKRSTMSAHVSTPRNRTLIDAQGREIVLRAGAITEADDGTLNFYAYIPWPFGGDPCSEKFGVKLGRWQLLPVVDYATLFCPLWHIVAREKSSYRAEDAGTLLGASMIEECIPELFRLERGSWESHFVRDLLKMVRVPCINAWHSKQKCGVEQFFDRLWTPASLIPGHVGRNRGRFHHVETLALACQQGRRDPRDHFLSIEEATVRVNKAIEFVNTEPIVSHSGWGKWVPQERYQAQMAESPRVKLDPSQAVFFSREQRVWTVRKATVGGNVEGPLLRFPIYFQCDQLWEFQGCKVKCYFDPYADQVLGTLVLDDDSWRNYKRGHIIARDVPALELPPQAILAEGWEDDALKRQLAIRKAISKAVRTEYCTWRGKRTTEARDGHGNISTAERGSVTRSNVPAPPQRIITGPAAEPQQRRSNALAVTTDAARSRFARQAERANRIREEISS